ncbi:MAG: ribosome biogenesis factor YjgA [Candidatus Methylumidiphilus sp.]
MTATDDFIESDEQQYAIRPNKSAIKRENAALEELGVELIALPKERLDKLDLSPPLHEAVKLAQTIANHHGAFKRQRKFIAKLLRTVDAEAIREQLALHTRQTARATHQLHAIERWRDRLLTGDVHELNALVGEHPDADRPKLRQLIRDARQETQAEAPPRSARLLFKYLRGLMLPEAEEDLDEHDEGDADDA